MVKLNLFIE